MLHLTCFYVPDLFLTSKHPEAALITVTSFFTRFSTKILVIRLVNGGRAGGWTGGQAYPKWRQTGVSAL